MSSPESPNMPTRPDGSPRHGYQQHMLEKSVSQDVRRLSFYLAITLFIEGIILLLFSPIATVLGLIFEATGIINNAAAMEIINEAYSGLAYLTAFLLPYLIYGKLCRYPLTKIPHDKPYFPMLFSSMGLAMGVSLFGGFLSSVALGFFSSVGLQPPDLNFGYPMNPIALTMNLINGILFPAVVEEMVYRGIIMGSLRKYGDGAAIFISSLLFGLAHGNMAQFPHAFLIGLAIAYCVVKTNSLYTGIFIHFVNNFVVTILDLIGTNMTNSQYALLFFIGHTMLYISCLVIALIYLLRVRRVSWRLAPSGCPLSRGVVVRRFLFTVPMVLALIMQVWKIFSSFT